MKVNESKFTGAVKAFSEGIVKSGAKVTSSSRPEIVLSSTYNKFIINDRARRILNVDLGDKLVFIDLMDGAADMEDRFYITVGFSIGDEEFGAKIANGYGFNYSKVYGAILNGELDVAELSKDDLIRKGLLREMESGNIVATKKIAMELVPYMEGKEVTVAKDEDGNDIMQAVYALKSFSVKVHKPKGIGKEKDEIEEVPFED